jgi:hypothetical protein
MSNKNVQKIIEKAAEVELADKSYVPESVPFLANSRDVSTSTGGTFSLA